MQCVASLVSHWYHFAAWIAEAVGHFRWSPRAAAGSIVQRAWPLPCLSRRGSRGFGGEVEWTSGMHEPEPASGRMASVTQHEPGCVSVCLGGLPSCPVSPLLLLLQSLPPLPLSLLTDVKDTASNVDVCLSRLPMPCTRVKVGRAANVETGIRSPEMPHTAGAAAIGQCIGQFP